MLGSAAIYQLKKNENRKKKGKITTTMCFILKFQKDAFIPIEFSSLNEILGVYMFIEN